MIGVAGANYYDPPYGCNSVMRKCSWALSGAFVCVFAAALAADTLVLRNGQRVDGELVSVRGDIIEFREAGWRGRVVQINRDEVMRIEFDRDRTPDRGVTLGGRPSGMREREVIVSADVAWNDSGVEVRAGQTLYFSAEGRVRWGPDRRDGPAGERNSPRNPNRPMPTRPAAGLIGKVGESATDYFFIGDEEGAIRMRSSGRLYLGINDDYLRDNTGNFRVTLYY